VVIERPTDARAACSLSPLDRPRRIWLCADDYGISPAVSAAIRELLLGGRLNATSVMVVAPSWSRSEASLLLSLRAAGRLRAIGLHLTLTGPFRPLTASFKPLCASSFRPLTDMIFLSWLRRLDRAALGAEIAAQLAAFSAAFGAAPDFLDGHQHVHLLPQVRDEVVRAIKAAAPKAWVRQCGSVRPVLDQLKDRKGLLLSWFSGALRRKAKAQSVGVNPAFAGSYALRPDTDFARLFPHFLDRLPDGGLIMCHPGRVDDELKKLDSLTALRETEYRYFASDAFVDLLRRRKVVLA
jgi:chitin disaccharide deacetylase